MIYNRSKTTHKTRAYFVPVWLDRNRNRFQIPLCFVGQIFWDQVWISESWNKPQRQIHWIEDGRRRWASVRWVNFRQFVLAIDNQQFDNIKLRKQSINIFIKFVWMKLINSDIWIKTRSRFCISFQETGFGFDILFVYNLMVSGSG